MFSLDKLRTSVITRVTALTLIFSPEVNTVNAEVSSVHFPSWRVFSVSVSEVVSFEVLYKLRFLTSSHMSCTCQRTVVLQKPTLRFRQICSYSPIISKSKTLPLECHLCACTSVFICSVRICACMFVCIYVCVYVCARRWRLKVWMDYIFVR